MKKVLVVYNPMAGKKRRGDAGKIVKEEINKAGYSYQWFQTEPVKVQPLEKFTNQHFDLILAVGGDGTIREVINFLVTNKINTPLGIISRGSANLLAQSLQIPVFNLRKALRFALSQKPHKLDAMQVNNSYIGTIMAGLGYDAVFVKGASRALKRRLGFAAYIISFFKTFFLYHSRLYRITIDGKRYYAYGKLAAVFNVFSSGYTKIGSHISPQDGQLNLVILNPKSLVDVAINLFLLLAGKERMGKKKIVSFVGKNIAIKTKSSKKIQLDGEVFKGRNLQVKVLPQALAIIYDKQF